MDNDVLNDFQICLTSLICICGVFQLLGMLSQLKDSTSRKRVRDSELPFHSKRQRVLWSPLVRSLGPDDFKRHHRISNRLFKKIHKKIKHRIVTQSKYARKTCCRGKVSGVDSRSRLSMTLKHILNQWLMDLHQNVLLPIMASK